MGERRKLGRPPTEERRGSSDVAARMPRGGTHTKGETEGGGRMVGKPRNEPWQIHNYARAAAFRRLGGGERSH